MRRPYQNPWIQLSDLLSKHLFKSFQAHYKTSASLSRIWRLRINHQTRKMNSSWWWLSIRTKTKILNCRLRTCRTTQKMPKTLTTTWKILTKCNWIKRNNFTHLLNKSGPTTICQTRPKMMWYRNATRTTSVTRATSPSSPSDHKAS